MPGHACDPAGPAVQVRLLQAQKLFENPIKNRLFEKAGISSQSQRASDWRCTICLAKGARIHESTRVSFDSLQGSASHAWQGQCDARFDPGVHYTLHNKKDIRRFAWFQLPGNKIDRHGVLTQQ